MRSWLTLVSVDGDQLEQPQVFDLDGLSNRLEKVGQAEPLKLGSQAFFPICIASEATGAAEATLFWNKKYATWELQNDGPSGTLFINGRSLDRDSKRTLSFTSAQIQLGGAPGGFSGCLLNYERIPDVPIFAGEHCTEIPVVGTRLLIGRGEKSRVEDDEGKPRLCLDKEIRTVSSRQAEIRRDGNVFHVVNLNSSSSLRTILNGDQNFEERRLVFGDCLQIPGYPYYTFQFNGRGLVHVGGNQGLLARDLTRDLGAFKILTDVSLDLKGGDFVGILGGSGQGKSTLLNAISGISPATSGAVWLDNRKLSGASDMATAGIGYVPQEDIVHTELTVEEALMFAGRLRLDLPESLLRQAVYSVLKTLNLASDESEEKDRRKARISKLSGGQRKRVSVACELLTNPRSLLLDEPTSGLDPQTETALMDELSVLARQKRMGIICTTHVLQNSHVFSSLGFIQGGRLIFSGSPIDAVRYFLLGRPYDKNHAEGGSIAASVASMGSKSQEMVHEVDLLDKLPKVYDVISQGAEHLSSEEMENCYVQSEFHHKLEPIVSLEGAAGNGGKSPVISKKKKSGAGVFRQFGVLCHRQWKILMADPMNLLFLLAQAFVIGGLVGWVSENLVFQMFLTVIATLWFGCSNGAQQIVGEVAIFRRERLAGLGLNVYMFSKVFFLSLITLIQAGILYFTVLISSHVFHTDLVTEYTKGTGGAFEKDRQVFSEMFFSSLPSEPDKEQEKVGDGDGLEGLGLDFSTETDDYVIFQEGMESDYVDRPRIVWDHPTGLLPDSAEFKLFAGFTWFFRIRVNALNYLGVEKLKVIDGDDSELRGGRSWRALVAFHMLLRLVALVAAAGLGVCLGLTVSALVATPTQAVMWVPLILIPQILFGGFVVTSPEMTESVFSFSRFLPSYNAQQLMDVANVYGRKVPRMTNTTRMPNFLEVPPYEQETVKFYDRNGTKLTEKYDAISMVNKSWQNMIVDRYLVGGRFKEREASGTGKPDTVTARRDVKLTRGDSYISLSNLYLSVGILLGWGMLCYMLILLGLIRKQENR